MPILSAPGLDHEALRYILGQVRAAQQELDSAVEQLLLLPDTIERTERIKRYNRLQKSVERTYKRLLTDTKTWSFTDIPAVYRMGHLTAALQMNTSASFTLIHQEAVDRVAQDVFADVGNGLQQVPKRFKEMTDSLTAIDSINIRGVTYHAGGTLSAKNLQRIRVSSRGAVAQQLLTGERSPAEAARILRDDLLKEGIQIVDAGGKRWNPEAYTRMLMRTKTAQAYNAGSLNKYREDGVSRVQVFDGVYDTECAKANGQIWTVNYAYEHVIAHPNCTRGFGPMPGRGKVNRVAPSEVAAAVAKFAAREALIRLAARQIRRWDMPDEWAIDITRIPIPDYDDIDIFRRVDEEILIRLQRQIDEIRSPYIERVLAEAGEAKGTSAEKAREWAQREIRRSLRAATIISRGLLFAVDVPTPPSEGAFDDITGQITDAIRRLSDARPSQQETVYPLYDTLRRVSLALEEGEVDRGRFSNAFLQTVEDNLFLLYRYFEEGELPTVDQASDAFERLGKIWWNEIFYEYGFEELGHDIVTPKALERITAAVMGDLAWSADGAIAYADGLSGIVQQLDMVPFSMGQFGANADFAFSSDGAWFVKRFGAVNRFAPDQIPPQYAWFHLIGKELGLDVDEARVLFPFEGSPRFPSNPASAGVIILPARERGVWKNLTDEPSAYSELSRTQKRKQQLHAMLTQNNDAFQWNFMFARTDDGDVLVTAIDPELALNMHSATPDVQFSGFDEQFIPYKEWWKVARRDMDNLVRGNFDELPELDPKIAPFRIADDEIGNARIPIHEVDGKSYVFPGRLGVVSNPTRDPIHLTEYTQEVVVPTIYLDFAEERTFVSRLIRGAEDQRLVTSYVESFNDLSDAQFEKVRPVLLERYADYFQGQAPASRYEFLSALGAMHATRVRTWARRMVLSGAISFTRGVNRWTDFAGRRVVELGREAVLNLRDGTEVKGIVNQLIELPATGVDGGTQRYVQLIALDDAGKRVVRLVQEDEVRTQAILGLQMAKRALRSFSSKSIRSTGQPNVVLEPIFNAFGVVVEYRQRALNVARDLDVTGKLSIDYVNGGWRTKRLLDKAQDRVEEIVRETINEFNESVRPLAVVLGDWDEKDIRAVYLDSTMSDDAVRSTERLTKTPRELQRETMVVNLRSILLADGEDLPGVYSQAIAAGATPDQAIQRMLSNIDENVLRSVIRHEVAHRVADVRRTNMGSVIAERITQSYERRGIDMEQIQQLLLSDSPPDDVIRLRDEIFARINDHVDADNERWVRSAETFLRRDLGIDPENKSNLEWFNELPEFLRYPAVAYFEGDVNWSDELFAELFRAISEGSDIPLTMPAALVEYVESIQPPRVLESRSALSRWVDRNIMRRGVRLKPRRPRGPLFSRSIDDAEYTYWLEYEADDLTAEGPLRDLGNADLIRGKAKGYLRVESVRAGREMTMEVFGEVRDDPMFYAGVEKVNGQQWDLVLANVFFDYDPEKHEWLIEEIVNRVRAWAAASGIQRINFVVDAQVDVSFVERAFAVARNAGMHDVEVSRYYVSKLLERVDLEGAGLRVSDQLISYLKQGLIELGDVSEATMPNKLRSALISAEFSAQKYRRIPVDRHIVSGSETDTAWRRLFRSPLFADLNEQLKERLVLYYNGFVPRSGRFEMDEVWDELNTAVYEFAVERVPSSRWDDFDGDWAAFLSGNDLKWVLAAEEVAHSVGDLGEVAVTYLRRTETELQSWRTFQRDPKLREYALNLLQLAYRSEVDEMIDDVVQLYFPGLADSIEASDELAEQFDDIMKKTWKAHDLFRRGVLTRSELEDEMLLLWDDFMDEAIKEPSPRWKVSKRPYTYGDFTRLGVGDAAQEMFESLLFEFNVPRIWGIDDPSIEQISEISNYVASLFVYSRRELDGPTTRLFESLDQIATNMIGDADRVFIQLLEGFNTRWTTIPGAPASDMWEVISPTVRNEIASRIEDPIEDLMQLTVNGIPVGWLAYLDDTTQVSVIGRTPARFAAIRFKRATEGNPVWDVLLKDKRMIIPDIDNEVTVPTLVVKSQDRIKRDLEDFQGGSYDMRYDANATDFQKSAISDYKGSGYVPINSALRASSAAENIPDLRRQQALAIDELLDKLLDKEVFNVGQLQESLETFIFRSTDGAINYDLFRSHIGDDVIEPGFVSSTYSPDFARRWKPRGAQWLVDYSAIPDAGRVMDVGGEYEILLDRGIVYEVVGIQKIRILHMDEAWDQVGSGRAWDELSTRVQRVLTDGDNFPGDTNTKSGSGFLGYERDYVVLKAVRKAESYELGGLGLLPRGEAQLPTDYTRLRRGMTVKVTERISDDLTGFVGQGSILQINNRYLRLDPGNGLGPVTIFWQTLRGKPVVEVLEQGDLPPRIWLKPRREGRKGPKPPKGLSDFFAEMNNPEADQVITALGNIEANIDDYSDQVLEQFLLDAENISKDVWSLAEAREAAQNVTFGEKTLRNLFDDFRKWIDEIENVRYGTIEAVDDVVDEATGVSTPQPPKFKGAPSLLEAVTDDLIEQGSYVSIGGSPYMIEDVDGGIIYDDVFKMAGVLKPSDLLNFDYKVGILSPFKGFPTPGGKFDGPWKVADTPPDPGKVYDSDNWLLVYFKNEPFLIPVKHWEDAGLRIILPKKPDTVLLEGAKAKKQMLELTSWKGAMGKEGEVIVAGYGIAPDPAEYVSGVLTFDPVVNGWKINGWFVPNVNLVNNQAYPVKIADWQVKPRPVPGNTVKFFVYDPVTLKPLDDFQPTGVIEEWDLEKGVKFTDGEILVFNDEAAQNLGLDDGYVGLLDYVIIDSDVTRKVAIRESDEAPAVWDFVAQNDELYVDQLVEVHGPSGMLHSGHVESIGEGRNVVEIIFDDGVIISSDDFPLVTVTRIQDQADVTTPLSEIQKVFKETGPNLKEINTSWVDEILTYISENSGQMLDTKIKEAVQDLGVQYIQDATTTSFGGAQDQFLLDQVVPANFKTETAIKWFYSHPWQDVGSEAANFMFNNAPAQVLQWQIPIIKWFADLDDFPFTAFDPGKSKSGGKYTFKGILALVEDVLGDKAFWDDKPVLQFTKAYDGPPPPVSQEKWETFLKYTWAHAESYAAPYTQFSTIYMTFDAMQPLVAAGIITPVEYFKIKGHLLAVVSLLTTNSKFAPTTVSDMIEQIFYFTNSVPKFSANPSSSWETAARLVNKAVPFGIDDVIAAGYARKPAKDALAAVTTFTADQIPKLIANVPSFSVKNHDDLDTLMYNIYTKLFSLGIHDAAGNAAISWLSNLIKDYIDASQLAHPYVTKLFGALDNLSYYVPRVLDDLGEAVPSAPIARFADKSYWQNAKEIIDASVPTVVSHLKTNVGLSAPSAKKAVEKVIDIVSEELPKLIDKNPLAGPTSLAVFDQLIPKLDALPASVVSFTLDWLRLLLDDITEVFPPDTKAKYTVKILSALDNASYFVPRALGSIVTPSPNPVFGIVQRFYDVVHDWKSNGMLDDQDFIDFVIDDLGVLMGILEESFSSEIYTKLYQVKTAWNAAVNSAINSGILDDPELWTVTEIADSMQIVYNKLQTTYPTMDMHDLTLEFLKGLGFIAP